MSPPWGWLRSQAHHARISRSHWRSTVAGQTMREGRNRPLWCRPARNEMTCRQGQERPIKTAGQPRTGEVGPGKGWRAGRSSNALPVTVCKPGGKAVAPGWSSPGPSRRLQGGAGGHGPGVVSTVAATLEPARHPVLCERSTDVQRRCRFSPPAPPPAPPQKRTSHRHNPHR